MNRRLPVGPPEVIEHRVDPTDNTASFVVNSRARGVDVAATLAYLNPDIDAVLEHLHRVLRFAVTERNMLARLSIPMPTSTNGITTQSKLVTHIEFGDSPTYDDVEYTFETVYGTDESRLWLARLAMGAVDTGRLLGHVIETTQQNEFSCATEHSIAEELHVLTESHYEL